MKNTDKVVFFVLNESLRSTLRYDSNFTNEGYTCNVGLGLVKSQQYVFCLGNSRHTQLLCQVIYMQISNTTIWARAAQ